MKCSFNFQLKGAMNYKKQFRELYILYVNIIPDFISEFGLGKAV